jgi:hypothetical protein
MQSLSELCYTTRLGIFLILVFTYLLSGCGGGSGSAAKTTTVGTPVIATQANNNLQELVTAINSLANRVDKLEGKFASADVAGTYTVSWLGVSMNTLSNNVVGVATLRHQSIQGTVTLNADGTGGYYLTDSSAQFDINGSLPGAVSVTTGSVNYGRGGIPAHGTNNIAWSLSGNTLTINGFPFNGDTFQHAAGGRLFINVGHTFSESSGEQLNFLRLLMRN